MSSTATLTGIHDPSSPEYKKARRRYLKTTRNRDSHVDSEWTLFRAAEKKYKTRFPPPDLSNVLDLAALDESRVNEIGLGGWMGRRDATEWKEISPGRKAYVLPRIPGLVVLPSTVSHQEQRDLIQWSLRDHARNPNETNLDTHYIVPQDGIWNAFIRSQQPDGEDEMIHPQASSSSPPESCEALQPGPRKLISNDPASPDNFQTIATSPKVPAPPSNTVSPAPASALVHKLRWANIGWSYHWGSKQYDFSKEKVEVDPTLRGLCRRIVKSIEWTDVFRGGEATEADWGPEGPDWMHWKETYDPDAGIVNFYQTKDTLMAHVDRSEVCATSPLVSISLGNAAIFLIGGLTRDTEPTAILLRSGDVVIMSGPACRRAYHGVPRILENTLPTHLEVKEENDSEWRFYADYMQTSRINVNVRQVFPMGFNPHLHDARK
ncbi:hypothetical protein NEOLEDRAFT_1163471 [Neolentinus lepideus HHB14362 ss-1]|uniref:Fe2OG dioxygenase domain-containing protein n=1 Tax=Neolentinus lepideus HHB14362 ss-1 TaxID=1314782 RepID=A0A165RPY7_9AGAM|nr:hypothetical protein NEOLEDRAFT_1163471 [Neolentinus lepideus HHB14362 ss-1]